MWVAILSLPIRAFEIVGNRAIGIYEWQKGFVTFVIRTVRMALSRPFRADQFFAQFEFIGNQSLNIVILSSFSVGSVFGLQIGGVFKIFTAESLLGAATGLTLSRELAPILTAVLLIGRAGSSMTAEISTMKVNEQIDAMEAMSVSPISYLVVPRFWACLLAGPLLTGVCIFVGLFGAYIVGIGLFDVDQGIFMQKLTWMMNPSDVMKGLQKAFIFGMVIPLVCCYFGLKASGGAKGVGKATTDAVVVSLLVVLLCDFIITYIQIAME